MKTTTESVTRPSIGLAITSLVLGILALVLGLFLIGGVLGIVGVLLGIAHLRRPGAPKGMAVTGMLLSLIGMLLAGAMTPVYIKVFRAMKDAIAKSSQAAMKVDEWRGVPAPNLTVTTLDGSQITLAELKGKRVVLDFWATWCPPCRKEIPHFIQLRKEVDAENLVIVGISQEEESVLKPFVAKEGINYPVASGRDFPLPYSGVTSIPTTFFIDRNGVIQDIVIGYHDLAALRQRATGIDYAGESKTAPLPAAVPPAAEGPVSEAAR